MNVSLQQLAHVDIAGGLIGGLASGAALANAKKRILIDNLLALLKPGACGS
jgi:hypothetical protein